MIQFLASGFYSGYLPKAPGTWGTLVALPLILGCHYVGIDLMLASLVVFVVGCYVSQKLTCNPESDPDPSYIVIDEIAGMFLTVALCLHFGIFHNIGFVELAEMFILFRIFDIWKPWPIGWADEQFAKNSKTRGFGVMIDDIFASIWAVIVSAILIKIKLYIP